MKFTQFLRPNGNKRPMIVDRPENIETKAKIIEDLGFKFEIEILSTGFVHLDCCDYDRSVYGDVCVNDESITKAVDSLVNISYELLQKEGLINE